MAEPVGRARDTAAVNRTDRLYALVEELRAVAPRPRSASWLARRFEVSVRTVERDLDALREAGVPIYAEAGRTGGYTLDRLATLPPLALTVEEALAMSVALREAEGSPFAAAARSAGQKVLATLPEGVREREGLLATRIHTTPLPDAPDVRSVVGEAVTTGRLVHLGYAGAAGAATERDVEPLGLLHGDAEWYLVGWCRLRDGLRGFRLDRITAAQLRDEIPRPRDPAVLAREMARLDVRPLRG
jgi:predicted DNA-binding transcriptional regulator YafY